MFPSATQSATCTTTQNSAQRDMPQTHTKKRAQQQSTTAVFSGKSHSLKATQPASTSLLRRLCRVCLGINNMIFCSTFSRHWQLLQLQKGLFLSQQGCDTAEPSKAWRLATGTLSLAVQLALVVNRELHNELVGWMKDATNIADHLTQFNRNPIPDYYYTMGDCYRFSSALAGNTHVQPYANFDDIIAIKARFGLITLAYSALGC